MGLLSQIIVHSGRVPAMERLLTKYDNDSYYYIGLFANNEGTIKNLKIEVW